MRVHPDQIYGNPLHSRLEREGDDTPSVLLRFVTATPFPAAGVSPDEGPMERSKITIQVGWVLVRQEGG